MEENDVADVLNSMRNKPLQKKHPYKLKLRNWLNAIFILLAILTVVAYFFCPSQNKATIVFAVGSSAVIIKMAEVMIRLTHRHSKK